MSHDGLTGKYEWLRLSNGVGRKYFEFVVVGSPRTIDFSDELFRVTEMVRCSSCKVTLTECMLPPRKGPCCRAKAKKTVSIEMTILNEFMCLQCPEHMELDELATV